MTEGGRSNRDRWPTNDWRRAAPVDLGLDEKLLTEADRRIGSDLVGVYSLLVVRHGRIGYERYYGDHAREDAFSIQSVTKSVTGALVGIALGDGLLGLDQTIGDLLPASMPDGADPQSAAITVAHLLAMTAGFAWDDLRDFWRATDQDDWVRAILATPLAHAPGTAFTYNTGCSQLLSAIVTAATGRSAASFAADRLFGPLGIALATWPSDPQGNSTGGFGLELTARDMAKLGYLFLHHGQWNGTRVVPADYVRAATTAHSNGGFPESARYGYHWWIGETAGHATFFAAGYGGQYVYVIPDLDLVVVTTARWQLPPAETLEVRPLIDELVVPAVA